MTKRFLKPLAGARRGLTLALVAILLLASVALASSSGPYDLSWWTVDGGGGTASTGGSYTLSGTSGQSDAGALTGGSYALSGGFWTPQSCYTLATTADPAAGGSITADPAPNCGSGKYTEGTVVELTAVPADGHTFDEWRGDASGSDNPVTVTMDSNHSVTAHFEEVAVPCYTLATTADPAAGGSITADPAPNCGGGKYTEGTAVTLTASPAAGYTFDRWSGDASGSDNSVTITMDADHDVTVHFITRSSIYLPLVERNTP